MFLIVSIPIFLKKNKCFLEIIDNRAFFGTASLKIYKIQPLKFEMAQRAMVRDMSHIPPSAPYSR